MSGLAHHSAHTEGPSRLRVALAIAAVAVYALGVVGFIQYEHVRELKDPNAPHPPVTDAFYHALAMFALHGPSLREPVPFLLEFARFGAAAVLLFTAAVAVAKLFAIDAGRWFLSDHVVVCGLSPRALAHVRCHRGLGESVVLIEPEPEHALAKKCRQLGVHWVVGNFHDPATLKQARVHKAKRLLAVSGSDGERIEAATCARNWLAEADSVGTRELRCEVQVSDIDLRTSLQQHAAEHGRSPRCSVHFFDFYATSAHELLTVEMPLDGDGIAPDAKTGVRLVILGFGSMGRAVAVEAAQIGHFANGLPLSIEVIDRHADLHQQALLFRYPNFEKACAIHFHDLQIESTHTRQLLDGWIREPNVRTTIACCVDDEALAVELALRLLDQPSSGDTRLALRMSSHSGLGRLIEYGVPSARAGQVKLFGVLDPERCERVYGDPERDQLARAIHEDFLEGARRRGESMGKASRRPWAELDDLGREPNRRQADHVATKLRAVGAEAAPIARAKDRAPFDLAPHVEVLAELEHRRWCAERWLAGWTLVRDQPRNDDERTTPYLVPWSDLPANALTVDGQDKDRETVRGIPLHLARVQRALCARAPNR
jgi:hypothetical protein